MPFEPKEPTHDDSVSSDPCQPCSNDILDAAANAEGDLDDWIVDHFLRTDEVQK